MGAEVVAQEVEQLKSEGKIRHFGVSNFAVHQLAWLGQHTQIENHQIEHSLLGHPALDDGRLEQCVQMQILPTAWLPLGGGEMFAPSDHPQIQRIQHAAKALADVRSLTPEQVLLAWVCQHPAGIVPIVGRANMERIFLLLQSANWRMTRENWYGLLEASRGQRVA